jgi:putative endonuclease
LGSRGEELAAAFLERQGYRIVERNYRKRYGEIDIIAEDGGEIVFVEVKTRKSDRFGSPFEAVDARKQRKISRVATAYLENRNIRNRAARFDVVAVRPGSRGEPGIEVIRNAFEMCGD